MASRNGYSQCPPTIKARESCGFVTEARLEQRATPCESPAADCFKYPYKVTACVSWNCILVPGLTVNVPAVCPYRACRPVLGGLPGWKLFVFTDTLRPFTEIDVSSRVSGSFLRGLARDDLIFPNAFAPAFNRSFPLTVTS